MGNYSPTALYWVLRQRRSQKLINSESFIDFKSNTHVVTSAINWFLSILNYNYCKNEVTVYCLAWRTRRCQVAWSPTYQSEMYEQMTADYSHVSVETISATTRQRFIFWSKVTLILVVSKFHVLIKKIVEIESLQNYFSRVVL